MAQSARRASLAKAEQPFGLFELLGKHAPHAAWLEVLQRAIVFKVLHKHKTEAVGGRKRQGWLQNLLGKWL